MPQDRLLAIDVGTQSVRALVFDGQGELTARAQIPIQAYTSGRPGWAEQAADVYWQAMTRACQQLLAEHPREHAGIAALGLTVQRATVVAVDAANEPLYPAITWMDKRRATALPALSWRWRLLFTALGLADTVGRFQADAKSNWLAQHEPAVHAGMHKFLLLSGYLSRILTGQWRDSTASQVGFIPFDYKRQAWASAGDWRWQALQLQPRHMPELVPCGQLLGNLEPDAARALGLPAGLPIVSAGADKACEVLGSGCISADIASLSFGTTATVNACYGHYFEATRLLPAYPAALPGVWNSEVNIYRGFWLVSWFKQQFAMHEQQQAELRGLEPEALLDRLIADIPPGSMGLTLQPYWSPGVRDPGPEAKGAIIGFGDVHQRGHVYRSILEGLIYGLREGAERIQRRGKTPITLLRVAGGGSQSDVAMQIAADIFGLPAERPHVYEASGLGAAINAAVGLGWYPDHARAVAAMTRPGRRFEPRADAVQIYEQLYARVYRRMYKRLQPLYEDIRRITGYPE